MRVCEYASMREEKSERDEGNENERCDNKKEASLSVVVGGVSDGGSSSR